jgi:glycine cleavage system H lipoate-binding protein
METVPPDLFATKGVEYLIVIGYLVALVVIWRLLREPGPVVAVRPRVGGWFVLPEEYCFHQGHSWAIPEDQNVVRVGMDDFAHRLLGRPDAIELPAMGTHLLQGERGWEIRVGSTSLGMLSPVEGEVVGVNYEVVDSPEILCSDPYNQGWLLKVRVPEQRRNQRNLLCGTLAQAWLEEQLRSMRVDLGLVLPELEAQAGCDGFARVVAPDDWREVAGNLLLSRESLGPGGPPARRVVGWFSLPDGYCFHQGHSWAAPQQENIVRVGIDEFVGWLLGPPSGLVLPALNHQLRQGERGWSLQIGPKSVGMLSPVEGEVVELNEAVLASPELLCSDPYGGGWLLQVRVPDRKRNQTNLLCGGLARTWMEQKVRAVRARAQPAPVGELVLPKSGTSPGCRGFARAVSPEKWVEVAGELLLSED